MLLMYEDIRQLFGQYKQQQQHSIKDKLETHYLEQIPTKHINKISMGDLLRNFSISFP